MSRNTKIILAVSACVVVFCGLACIAGFLFFTIQTRNLVSTATDPNKQQQVGNQIAEYTVPAGYKQAMGMDLLVEKVVMLEPTNNQGPAIMLIQLMTSTASQEELERGMQQAFQQSGTRQANYEVVGTHPVTIKGKATNLTVSESTAGTSHILRQATGVFPGKGGIAMIMFTGSSDSWDWKLIEDFCASIK